MIKELEKKYLIKKMPDLISLPRVEYERYFLSKDINNQVRVQRKNDIFELEKKIKIKNNEYIKEKKSISKTVFENLTKDLKDVIEKESFVVSKYPNITIKVYHGKYEGFSRAEVEFNSIEELENFTPPDWFGKEITNSDIGMDIKVINFTKTEVLSIKNNNERIDDLQLNGLKVIQNKEYFCFGMDSVLLANFVDSNSNKNIIMDFCSGSGVIPFIISAKKKCEKIIGVEFQKEMFDLLERNIALNNLSEKIVALNNDIKDVRFLREYILNKYNKDVVDIIVCNPPYKSIGTGVKNENLVKYIARHEIKCTLEDIFFSASKLLKSRGKLYLVHKPDRLVDLLVLSRKYGLEAKRIKFVHPRIESGASIVLIEYIKLSGAELDVQSPLIEFNENGDYTNQIYTMYEKKE